MYSIDPRCDGGNGRLLGPLVGNEIDYEAYARDTPPGKNCVCCLMRACARHVSLHGTPTICVDLTSNRHALLAVLPVPCFM